VQEAKAAKLPDPLTDNTLPRTKPLAKGDVGTIFDAKIKKVLSPNEALVVYFYHGAIDPITGTPRELIKPEYVVVMCNTEDMVDGQEWTDYLKKYEVTRTVKLFDLNKGSQTLWLLEPK
jgi:hypothetical protein